MVPPSKSSVGTEGSILLVEEYDALAAAIGSALKKFAPCHAVRVARSLPAATDLALETRPNLFIIDFDPPLAGALEFFDRAKTALPDTSTLIIAAGIPRDILRERRPPTALEFTEKPFQLVEFGAVVQALLGRFGDASSTRLRGTLRNLNLADMIPLLCLEGETKILSTKPAGEERGGEIHFAHGQIQHAAASGLQGIDALREMLSWASPDFTAVEGHAEARRSIEGPWPAVLQEVLRTMPRMQPRPPLQKPPDVPAPPKRVKKRNVPILRDGKKILVIEDTETLRVFVEEMLSMDDPRLQIATASSGAEGLSRSASLHPDVILLDYSLPDFNGDEVCRLLLESDETKQIPVIMMSGHVAEMADAAVRYENIVLTVPKPFLSAALIDAVTTMLAKPPEFRRPRPAIEFAIAEASAALVKDVEPAIQEVEHKANGKAPVVASHSEPALSSATPVNVSVESVTAPVPSVEAIQDVAPGPRPRLTPAHIPNASSDAIVVSIALEVVSMQFSPALRITAIRARPCSSVVSLRVDPRALPTVRLPETTFEIARVDLDGRGQIQTMQVVPAAPRTGRLEQRTAVAIERLAVLPVNGSGAIQLIPAEGAPLTIQLLAAFELAGVELSKTFGVSYLELNARGGRMRVILPRQAGSTGVTFETAQILLDRSAHIAEILLDLVVREG